MIQTSDNYWTLNKYLKTLSTKGNNLLSDKNMVMIDRICKSISDARNCISKIDPETSEGKDILEYKGMTGTKTRHLYNNMLSYIDDVRYLEIGTWYGSSSISAIYKNKVQALFIDNWSQFGGDPNIFMEALQKYEGDSDLYLIENNCWEVELNSLDKKFNIYLYDGGHTESDHYKSLEYYLPILDDTFVFMVDDWCWGDVRDGTMRAIRDLGLKIHFRHEEFLSSDDLIGMPKHKGKESWWNGVGIFLLSKS
jgi:hypothetical protein